MAKYTEKKADQLRVGDSFINRWPGERYKLRDVLEDREPFRILSPDEYPLFDVIGLNVVDGTVYLMDPGFGHLDLPADTKVTVCCAPVRRAYIAVRRLWCKIA